jgi:hypothetical protein
VFSGDLDLAGGNPKQRLAVDNEAGHAADAIRACGRIDAFPLVTVRLGVSVCLGPSPAWCFRVVCDSSGDWPRVVCVPF